MQMFNIEARKYGKVVPPISTTSLGEAVSQKPENYLCLREDDGTKPTRMGSKSIAYKELISYPARISQKESS